MLELNDVLISGEQSTLSLMAHEGQVTCLVGGSHWLQAMLGFESVVAGFISVDGEPLTPKTIRKLRRLMAFVPDRLDDVGEVVVYDAPTMADVFSLKANRQLDAALVQQELKQTGATGQKAMLLAVAASLDRTILLVDNPMPSSLPYLHRLAEKGRTVIVASTDRSVMGSADHLVEIKED